MNRGSDAERRRRIAAALIFGLGLSLGLVDAEAAPARLVFVEGVDAGADDDPDDFCRVGRVGPAECRWLFDRESTGAGLSSASAPRPRGPIRIERAVPWPGLAGEHGPTLATRCRAPGA